jgi:hypothetical protein
MAYPFNDTTNGTGICQDIDFFCDTDSTSYPLVDKARNANRWLYRLVVWMFKSSPDWEWDDKNHTTTPRARTTLVNAQQRYTLPTDMLRLKKVTVLDTASVEQELTALSFDEFFDMTGGDTSDTGIPTHFSVKGDEMFLYPTPSTSQVTLTDGLNLYISREADVFTAADTNQEAGIPEPFCRVLALGPSGDYWLKTDAPKARDFYAQISEIKAELLDFNENRVEDLHASIKTGRGRTTRQYM